MRCLSQLRGRRRGQDRAALVERRRARNRMRSEGFAYSDALQGKEGEWDYQNLDALSRPAPAMGARDQDGVRRGSRSPRSAPTSSSISARSRPSRRRCPERLRLGGAAVADDAAQGYLDFASGLADAAGAIVRRYYRAPHRGREQGRREPGHHRRSRGRGGAARADPGDLSRITASTARSSRASAWTPSSSGISTRSTAPSRSWSAARCSAR